MLSFHSFSEITPSSQSSCLRPYFINFGLDWQHPPISTLLISTCLYHLPHNGLQMTLLRHISLPLSCVKPPGTASRPFLVRASLLCSHQDFSPLLPNTSLLRCLPSLLPLPGMPIPSHSLCLLLLLTLQGSAKHPFSSKISTWYPFILSFNIQSVQSP